MKGWKGDDGTTEGSADVGRRGAAAAPLAAADVVISRPACSARAWCVFCPRGPGQADLVPGPTEIAVGQWDSHGCDLLGRGSGRLVC